MSTPTLLTNDGAVSDFPCYLCSLTITTEGGGPGKVQVYDGSGPETAYLKMSLLCPSNETVQFRWEGLYFDRGLYLDFVEKADYVLVEWEPGVR